MKQSKEETAMKAKRQALIREIVEAQSIQTQEEL